MVEELMWRNDRDAGRKLIILNSVGGLQEFKICYIILQITYVKQKNMD